MALKIQNRLKKKKEFEKVFKKGKSFKENFLILKFIENHSKESRFGFVVGKKISKKAVIRNRVQRKLKEQTKLILNNIKQDIDGVFVALPGLEQKKSLEIKQIIENIFKKARLFKD